MLNFEKPDYNNDSFVSKIITQRPGCLRPNNRSIKPLTNPYEQQAKCP